MKSFLMSFILMSCLNGVALAQYYDVQEDIPEENYYPEDHYEAEMFVQSQEDYMYPPISEEEANYLIEEEVYDYEMDYAE